MIPALVIWTIIRSTNGNKYTVFDAAQENIGPQGCFAFLKTQAPNILIDKHPSISSW